MTAFPLTFGEKSSVNFGPVNFGPVIMEISIWNHTHPNRLCQKTIFWPLGVLRPKIFTRATEWPSLASPYSTRDGGFPNNFFNGGSKIGLKCSICIMHAYNFGAKGISFTKLCHVMQAKLNN